MKKVVILFLVLILALPMVLGASYDLDLVSGALNVIVLEEKDEVRFDLLGATHSLYIRDIGKDGTVKLKLFPYLDSEKQSYGFLYEGISLETDLDQDGENDLAFGLVKIDEEGRVEIGFQILDGSKKLTDTGESEGAGMVVVQNNNKYLPVYIIAVAIVLLGMIAFFISRLPDEKSNLEKQPEKIIENKNQLEEDSKIESEKSVKSSLEGDKPSLEESSTEEE